MLEGIVAEKDRPYATFVNWSVTFPKRFRSARYFGIMSALLYVVSWGTEAVKTWNISTFRLLDWGLAIKFPKADTRAQYVKARVISTVPKREISHQESKMNRESESPAQQVWSFTRLQRKLATNYFQKNGPRLKKRGGWTLCTKQRNMEYIGSLSERRELPNDQYPHKPKNTFTKKNYTITQEGITHAGCRHSRGWKASGEKINARNTCTCYAQQ